MDSEVKYLYLDDIIPNRFQPRENFDEQALKELAVSIKEHGVIQPIVVRQIGEKYEIIAGERRYKASTMAGLTKIPAIVRNLDDKESSKVALIENLQRRDLTPIEEARTYQKILELDALTQEELARTMGKSQSAVSNKLRLLSLTDEVQDALLHEQISERHARSLLSVTNPEKQKELLNKVITTRMTVRELDEEIKNINDNSSTDGALSLDNPAQNNISLEKQQISNTSEQNQNTSEASMSNSLFPNLSMANVEENNQESQIESAINDKNGIESSNDLAENDESNKSATNDINDNFLGGNLFTNLSPIAESDSSKEESTVQNINSNEPEKSIDVIGGSGLLAGMTAEDTVKPQDNSQIQDHVDSTTENNLFKNFDSNIQQEQTVQSNNANSSNTEQLSIPSIVSKFKDTVSNIKNSGKKVELEEFDFDDFYQLVIRIDK